MFKSLLGGGTGSKKESKVSAATKTFTTAATGRGQAGDDDKNHMMDHDVFLEDTDRMLAEMNAGMASLSSGGGGGGADDYDLHHLTQVEVNHTQNICSSISIVLS